ncbi:DNA primase [Gangjinia marincola]|uniref:DNA primase n=1 Tax=Gangjinia marincola TaxID=578463 RepID=A0ABN1MJY8_9FLAO
MISKTTIDRVYEESQVEEVIGDFVQLKKSGSNYKGLSPFTQERTPSFMVSPAKQIWKDFSSGKGGNAVAFLMEHEHFTYPEAIKYLAKKYNIEIEETEQSDEHKEAANERESMYLVNEYAKEYFKKIMLETNQGQAIGLSYFKERGFTAETIEKFDLGYSPDEWEAFTKTALDKGYQLEFLDKTGLTIVKEAEGDKPKRTFDRFKGRVMFPIHSMSGRVLGFGGRILTSDKKAAKYLNSPESEVYHKSKVLYGIYHAKQAIAKEDNCYLVEGYTDVIQFYQSGIENTVASSGTALTPEQIRLINRLTKNITVLFDGDTAGMRASLRGIDLILEQGLNVRICTFPDGEDPDSFAKSNTEEDLKEYLTENAQDFIRFKASLLVAEAKDDPVKKAGLIRDMVASIAKIPDTIKQEVYVKECSAIMDISEVVLFSTLAQLNAKESADQAKRKKQNPQAFEVVKQPTTPRVKVDQLFELERKIMSMLLLYGKEEEDFEDFVLKQNEFEELELVPETHRAKVFEKIYLDLQEDEVEFTNEHFQQLYYTIISKLNEDEEFKLENIINELDPEQSQHVTNILMDDDKYALARWDTKDIFVKSKKENLVKELSQTILSLRCYLVASKIEELKQQTKAEEVKNPMDVLQDVMDYHKLQQTLSKKLDRHIAVFNVGMGR